MNKRVTKTAYSATSDLQDAHVLVDAFLMSEMAAKIKLNLMGTSKANVSLHLLFSVLAGLDGVVDVLHRPLNEIDCVRSLGLRVDTLLCHDSRNVPEHRLQLRLPFLVRHLELPLSQDLFERKK